MSYIHPITLLRMPNRESVEALEDDAWRFGDNGDAPDGDLWLAYSGSFSRKTLDRAMHIGGEIVLGYRFFYPRRVTVAEVGVGGWCGYNAIGIGYALRREVAEAVCVASFAAQEKEEE